MVTEKTLRCAIGGLSALLCFVGQPVPGEGQSSSSTIPPSFPWEVTLDGQAGVPAGYIKVTETGAPGTRLRLSDLGIDVSEAAELSVGYHFTPRDALRGSYLYYFLDGNTTLDRPILFNGQTFGPGHLHTNADFYQLTLQYERTVVALGSGGSLAASLGLTYVNFNPTLTGNGKSNSEDFYRQELPVPLVGIRADYPLGGRLGVTASLAGGGLPRVDSLRKEGGTVWLQQQHADAGLSLTYAVTAALRLDAGYHFTYLFQEEKSHEDQNTFRLFDNAFRLGLTYKF